MQKKFKKSVDVLSEMQYNTRMDTKENKKLVGIMLPKDIIEKLDEEASKKFVSRAALIRVILNEYFSK